MHLRLLKLGVGIACNSVSTRKAVVATAHNAYEVRPRSATAVDLQGKQGPRRARCRRTARSGLPLFPHPAARARVRFRFK